VECGVRGREAFKSREFSFLKLREKREGIGCDFSDSSELEKADIGFDVITTVNWMLFLIQII
jgi:hypothetical protein